MTAANGARPFPLRLWSAAAQGPLPAVLLALTVVTGLVDAVSILELGRVFVANMTGNVVFIGFALAGAKGFSVSASLSALAAFLVGASAGGVLIGRIGSDRGRLVQAGLLAELAFVSCALGIMASSPPHLGDPERDVVAALLALATGIQNAVARRVAVPDLTTTVLTMTLTGLAADLRSEHPLIPMSRRFLAVATMFTGAIVGAVLALHGHAALVLGIVVGLLAVASIALANALRRDAAWRHAPSG